MLLAFGFLASCFSVEAFAADDSGQQVLSLSGGLFSVYWYHNTENCVSYGNFTNETGFYSQVTSVEGMSTSHPVAPEFNSFKLTFDTAFHVIAGRRYLVQLSSIAGASFGSWARQGTDYTPVLSFYDQYNNLSWSTDAYQPGVAYSQNGFLYFLIDVPMSFDVKNLQVMFQSPVKYGNGVFDVGKGSRMWLQIMRLADDDARSADQIIQAVENQTAADQKRYDDFTSGGSEQGSNLIDGAQDSISQKIGILDFAEGTLSDFVQLFSADPGDATLTLPGFKWHDAETGQDLTVWDAQTFDFAFIGEHFGPLVSALRVGTVLAVYGAMLWYLQGVFERIFGGGGSDD